uniref:Uncharacterized protein n=1 Tax=Rhabditophanes sp. KR3021 TaxID=114890 RepID=A0AC35TM64_9BILA
MNFRTIAAFIAFFIASASAQYYSPYAGYAGSAYAGYLGAGYAGYYPGAYSGYYAGAFATIAALIAFFIASASAQYYSPYAGYAGYLGAGYAGYYPGAYSSYYAGAFASPYFGYGSNQAQNKVANAPSNLKLTNNIA